AAVTEQHPAEPGAQRLAEAACERTERAGRALRAGEHRGRRHRDTRHELHELHELRLLPLELLQARVDPELLHQSRQALRLKVLQLRFELRDLTCKLLLAKLRARLKLAVLLVLERLHLPLLADACGVEARERALKG